jgi:hypothetical protein
VNGYSYQNIVIAKVIQPTARISAHLRERLQAMQRPYNWDYQRAKAITKRDCALALEVVERIGRWGFPEPTFVSPSPTGAVALSWRSGNEFVALEITDKKPGSVYLDYSGTLLPRKQEWVPLESCRVYLSTTAGLRQD